MEECAQADSDAMKQLPGRPRPRWQQQLISGLVFGLGLVLMAALLPVVLPILLIAGLLAGLALIPILRQLRNELEQLDQVQKTSSERIPMDVTPWQQKLWDRWKASLNRRS
ncbi:hypothetical protein [Synechococcus sp. UW179B]|jgi:hypothetical protein|uniref:hypothetical protein n=1 Tax=Synechococcus sp. UW179B TaxID=2575516 RepID=UPI000E0E8562|nr:hypothetical protein [Synechococcus sp. UW179B]